MHLRPRPAAALLLLLGVSSVSCSAQPGADEESWAVALPAAVQPQLFTTSAASGEQRRQRRLQRRALWEWPAEWNWQQSPAPATDTPSATAGGDEAGSAADPPPSPPPSPPPPPPAVELPSLRQRWESYGERLAAISVDGRRLTSMLGTLLDSYRCAALAPAAALRVLCVLRTRRHACHCAPQVQRGRA